MNKEFKNLLVFGYGLTAILTFILIRGILKHGFTFISFVLFFAAVFFLSITILNLGYLKIIYDKWMKAGHFIGSIVSSVVLMVVFYFVFTPLSLLFKLMKKDLLNQKIDKDCESYWIKREKAEFNKESYSKQF